MAENIRTIEAYKNYFAEFMAEQDLPVRKKVYWTLNLIETNPRVSRKFLKKLEGTAGLFEIRVEFGGDIFRIFCFFDERKTCDPLERICEENAENTAAGNKASFTIERTIL